MPKHSACLKGQCTQHWVVIMGQWPELSLSWNWHKNRTQQTNFTPATAKTLCINKIVSENYHKNHAASYTFIPDLKLEGAPETLFNPCTNVVCTKSRLCIRIRARTDPEQPCATVPLNITISWWHMPRAGVPGGVWQSATSGRLSPHTGDCTAGPSWFDFLFFCLLYFCLRYFTKGLSE